MHMHINKPFFVKIVLFTNFDCMSDSEKDILLKTNIQCFPTCTDT